MPICRLAIALVAITLPLAVAPFAHAADPEPMRAVWVARMHYRYADDVRTIIRNCAQRGLNTVFWQVRGEGTVAYPSEIEPWAAEFGHRAPGFDPLAVALEAADEYDVALHAWVNVMPGWRGKTPPPETSQLYHAQPDWFLYDEAGARQPLNDFYVILNPCLPEVKQHLAAVCAEVVRKYPVDGLHLDYVRYAWDTTANAKQRFPRDPVTVGLYRRATGLHPDDDEQRWNRWRADQITELVGLIRTTVRRERGDLPITAAVAPDPQRAYDRYLQDGPAWLELGFVDALAIMAYTADAEQFARYIEAYQQRCPRGRIIPGLGLYKHETLAQTATQLERCMAWGGDFALFSYASLHPTHGDRAQVPVPRETQRAWLVRRAALDRVLDAGR